MLEELNIPYIVKFVDFSEAKKEPYTLINPNGRLPAIHDPNTNLYLWESGAITECLIEKYDPEHRISHSTFPEQYHTKQWLYFQVSGQAPYYGQVSWFQKLHPEELQSAIDRYRNEIHHVCGVLETVLGTREWLVGDKCTYADLCFIAWQRWAPRFGCEDIHTKYLRVGAWMEKMEARPTFKKVYADQDRAWPRWSSSKRNRSPKMRAASTIETPSRYVCCRDEVRLFDTSIDR